MSFKSITNLYKYNFLVILIYFVLLFCLDYSGLMNLYGENFVRRFMNLFRRRDELSYYKKLKPFCEPVKRMLSPEDIKQLQSIKIPTYTDVPWFSRTNTTTHQCCEKYSETEKNIIKEISEKIRKKYEIEIGKKLYYKSSETTSIYVYHGKNSQHLWHVDPKNLNEIYNVIICIKKKGGISPLQCKDSKGEVKSVHFEEGDAAIFNGGTTVHQVPPNEDDDSERTVLSLSFISDEKLNDMEFNNMCTYTEGGNNYLNIVKLLVFAVVINFIISYIAGVDKLSYTFIGVLLVFVLIIIKYVPLYLDTGLGSGRASSISYNLLLVLLFIILVFSFKGGILFFIYFALSDVFFPRSWVEYD
jgi:hypothetical protein